MQNRNRVFVSKVKLNYMQTLNVNKAELKLMPQTKEKCDSLVFGRSCLCMVWRCHGILRVHCFYFCLKPTVRKDTWMATTFVTVMLYFFRKCHLLDHSYVQSFFWTITRHIENSILKDTLQLNNFRHGLTYLLNRWKCLEKDQLNKNPSVHFEDHYT